MPLNHPDRTKTLLVSNKLDEFLKAIELLYPKGAFIRPCLHPESGLYCLVDDATRRRPRLVVRISPAVDADLKQLQLPLGSEIGA